MGSFPGSSIEVSIFAINDALGKQELPLNERTLCDISDIRDRNCGIIGS